MKQLRLIIWQINIFLFPYVYADVQLTEAYQHVLNGAYEQALELYLQALPTHPHDSELLCNIGFILKKQNDFKQAIEFYEKARAIGGKHSRIERAISHAYLSLGNFDQGWQAYEYRWVNPPSYNNELKNYIENKGSLHNKKILLKTEYGLGDTLQFIRYAIDLKNMGATLIIEAQQQLVPLLSLCPYIDVVIHPGSPVPSVDFQALLMSLPLILQNSVKKIPTQIPYLYADQKLVAHWKARLADDDNFKVGICWQADTRSESQYIGIKLDSQAKSLPLHYFARLSLVPGISLYSLQKINGLEQLKQIEFPYSINNFGDFDCEHGPFMDTAAIIENLDLVITIDTSIAHLAGGLGKKVWIVLPYHCDWRWMVERSDSPWYPSMRLFRQPKADDWNSVIEDIKMALLFERYNRI